MPWVEAFNTGHLVTAANRFLATANHWEESFLELARTITRPGGREWSGRGAEAAQDNTDRAAFAVRKASNMLRDAADIAAFGADQLDGLRAKTLAAIADARGDGYLVNADLSTTDTRRRPETSSACATRQAQAEEHAEIIQSYAAQLQTLDNEYAARLEKATDGLDTLNLDPPDGDTRQAPEHSGVHLFGNRIPMPEGPKNPAPLPPPGGWSNDPVTRAAQKIAYGHAWTRHASDFNGMTKDQLAQQIDRMFRANVENPASLTIGRTADGAAVLYDPKTNIVVIRDPGALDAGTAFKPDKGANYVENGKIATRMSSIPPGELADGTPKPASSAEARPPQPRQIPPSVIESTPELKSPPPRGSPALGLPGMGAMPDGTLPYLVDPPGPDAGGPDLPVIGDGEPDGPGSD